MNELIAVSDLLARLRNKFEVDEHQIHMLAILAQGWKENRDMRVMELVRFYTRTSLATSHKAVQELVSKQLLKKQVNKSDTRVVHLIPGAKLKNYAAELRRSK